MNNDYFDEYFGNIEAFDVSGNFFWGTTEGTNILLKIDFHSGFVEKIRSISHESPKKRRLYGDAVITGNKMFLVPLAADRVSIYDFQTDAFTVVDIENQEDRLYKKDYKFCRGIEYNDFIFLFPVSYPAIMRINKNDYSVVYYSDWVSTLKKMIPDQNKVYFRNIYTDGNKVYAPSCGCNVVLEFDMITQEQQVHIVGKETDYFSDLSKFNNNYYLSSLDGIEILVLDQCWTELNRILTGHMTPSIGLNATDKDLFFFAYKPIYSMRLDCSNVIFRDIFDDEKCESDYLYRVKEYKDYSYGVLKNKLFKINMDTKDVEYVCLTLSQSLIDEVMRFFFDCNQIVHEDKGLLLSWIRFL